jgi:hypothetical protein
MVIAEQGCERKKEGGKKKGTGGNAKRTESGTKERVSERGSRREKGKEVRRGEECRYGNEGIGRKGGGLAGKRVGERREGRN